MTDTWTGKHASDYYKEKIFAESSGNASFGPLEETSATLSSNRFSPKLDWPLELFHQGTTGANV